MLYVDCGIIFLRNYLKNEFIFGMFMKSLIPQVSCKVTLEETRSIHYSMNRPKLEFITYIYILLYISKI